MRGLWMHLSHSGHVTAEKALDALAGLAFLEDAESSLCWQAPGFHCWDN